jgi:hypothetical protein
MFSGFFFSTINISNAQENYVLLSDQEIYLFLDELAAEHYIELNSCIKPYSRIFIAKKLKDAKKHLDKMNKRMRDKLHFYLLDYGKDLHLFKGKDFYFSSLIDSKNKVAERKKTDLFFYDDSLFTISINPIFSINFNANKNGKLYHRSKGASINTQFANRWGFYISLRDNYFSQEIDQPNYLIPIQGILQKVIQNGNHEGEQIHGGVSYSWEWGSIGVIKDHINWGDNYHGPNIISDRAPSFARINLNLKPIKWFEFNYFHAWLVSGVIDSSKSRQTNNKTRTIMHKKYMAVNMFTFKPFKHFHISAGNSIVYSDIGIHPAYLIPVMFFKAVDHSINGQSNWTGQNAQMFFNVSSRQIKHLHLYSSLFIDEISFSRMWVDSLQSNTFSWKVGAYCSNLIPNLGFGAEYTRTNPYTFKHFIPTTTFESNFYTLGNYLTDNAHEFYFQLNFQPHHRWKIHSAFTFIEKGPNYTETIVNTKDLHGLPFLDEILWYYKSIDLSFSFNIMHNTYANLGINYSISPKNNAGKYLSEYYSGELFNLYTGIRLGF